MDSQFSCYQIEVVHSKNRVNRNLPMVPAQFVLTWSAVLPVLAVGAGYGHPYYNMEIPASASLSNEPRPNIVVFMADDLVSSSIFFSGARSKIRGCWLIFRAVWTWAMPKETCRRRHPTLTGWQMMASSWIGSTPTPSVLRLVQPS